MIIDKKSISKFGDVPKAVLDLAKKADSHGKYFSQWTSALYVYYKESKNKSLEGWMIIDNQNRRIYNSIFYSTFNNKFYMQDINDLLLYEYKDENCSKLHASQFFLMGITDNLINNTPSKRNF